MAHNKKEFSEVDALSEIIKKILFVIFNHWKSE